MATLNKWERKEHRKQMRKARHDADRRDEASKKTKPRTKTYRKDKEGNIILWGYLKVTWVALLMIGAIIVIAVFFAVLLITNEEIADSDNCRNPFCQFFFEQPSDIKFLPDEDLRHLTPAQLAKFNEDPTEPDDTVYFSEDSIPSGYLEASPDG